MLGQDLGSKSGSNFWLVNFLIFGSKQLKISACYFLLNKEELNLVVSILQIYVLWKK